jgi:hypothetical protein
MCSLARAHPPANRGAHCREVFCVFGFARPDNLAFDFFEIETQRIVKTKKIVQKNACLQKRSRRTNARRGPSRRDFGRHPALFRSPLQSLSFSAVPLYEQMGVLLQPVKDEVQRPSKRFVTAHQLRGQSDTARGKSSAIFATLLTYACRQFVSVPSSNLCGHVAFAS